MLGSIVCRYADFSAPWYREKEFHLRIREIMAGHSASQVDFVNRKFWEWCAITQALDERSLLRTGMKGLGFAVGREPLASYFGARGARVVATDLHPENSEEGWILTNQYAASKEDLFQPLLIDHDLFETSVSFQAADMRTLEGLEPGYDFIWSSCALEHLGTLQAGLDFIVRSAELLTLGGVATHTTEFNVLSDDVTIEEGSSVIYRRQDICGLVDTLSSVGLRLVPPNFDVGDHPYDLAIDTPPYMVSGKPHLKLEWGGYICTSMLLIIEKLGGVHPV
jgi:hypothetical protein